MVSLREFPPNLSPWNNGGRTISITRHPSNNLELIVATEFGGFWKTTDRGAHWFHLNNLSTVFGVDVAYAPDGITVIATLARDNGFVNGGGIWVSRSGGIEWTRPATATPPSSDPVHERINAYSISYAPDQPNTVYVGTDYGIAISADYGATWRHVMLQSTRDPVHGVLPLRGNRVIVTSTTGVWRSDDGGSSWRNVRFGDYGRWGNKTLDVSPHDHDKVFVMLDPGHLLMYTVSTEEWVAAEGRPMHPRGRGCFLYLTPSWPDRRRTDFWVANNGGLNKLTLRDLSQFGNVRAHDWTEISAGLHSDPGDLGLDTNNRPLMYGCDGGLFKPTNRAATEWTAGGTARGGWNSLQITSMAGTNVHVGRGRNYTTSLYLMTQDNSNWASPDGGRRWPTSVSNEGSTVQVQQDAESNSEVTVAYWTEGDGPQFSDANFLNARSVPNLDMNGVEITGLENAIYLSPGHWLRLRSVVRNTRTGAVVDTEVWVSENNGRNWRKKAYMPLSKQGVPVVAGHPSDPKVYIPVLREILADGRPIVGLIKLTRIYNHMVEAYDASDVITPGPLRSLGIVATMFDWHAVFGVDPTDADYILAPDINGGVIMSSRNGGARWGWEFHLSNLVTQLDFDPDLPSEPHLLLYDGDSYHMQITYIGFDPYHHNHIMIGTRDAGIMQSYDRGRSWQQIVGSDIIRYITGMFFKRDNTVIVSTYGRGLWLVDPNIRLYDPRLHCHEHEPKCWFLRDPHHTDVLSDPVDWAKLDVLVFLNGRINGLALSGKKVKQITVTPGTIIERYAGQVSSYPGLNIVDSAKGRGFDNLKGCEAALQNGEVIKGIILQGGAVFGIISGENEFKSEQLEPEEATDAELAQKALVEDKQDAGSEPAAGGPYLFVTANMPSAGLPIVGADGQLKILAHGFHLDPDEQNLPMVAIDGEVTEKDVKVDEKGVVQASVMVPDFMRLGIHSIEVRQNVGGKDIVARGRFVTAPIEDHHQMEQPGKTP